MINRLILFIIPILLICNVQASATSMNCENCFERTPDIAWMKKAEAKGPVFSWYLNGRDGVALVGHHQNWDWLSIASNSPFRNIGINSLSEGTSWKRSDKDIYPIPEPLTLSLIGIGLIVMGAGARRNKLNTTKA